MTWILIKDLIKNVILKILQTPILKKKLQKWSNKTIPTIKKVIALKNNPGTVNQTSQILFSQMKLTMDQIVQTNFKKKTIVKNQMGNKTKEKSIQKTIGKRRNKLQKDFKRKTDF